MIIGIDPGLTGAIAIFSNYTYIDVHDMPIMAHGKGKAKVKNQVNAAALSKLIKEEVQNYSDTNTALVYLERISAMPGQGVSSMFSMGDTFGCIRGVCASLGLPIQIITPQKWKKHFGIGKDKEIIRAKAIEQYPEAPLSRK